MTNKQNNGEQAAMTKMAAVLMEKMRQIGDKPNVLDFGSILGDYSLKTNSFPAPIPKGAYFVCRIAALSDRGNWNTTANADNHTHAVPLPESLTSVQPGDRVLVAWVDDDPVVIDKFMPATVVEVKTNGRTIS